MNIVIRKPNVSEIPDIIPFWMDSQDYHNTLDSEYYISSSQLDTHEETRYLTHAIQKDTPHVRIALADGKLAGLITFQIGKNSYGDTRVVEYVEVKELYVVPGLRGKKIGERLLSVAEEYARHVGLSYIKLQCASGNEGALRFYARNGYVDRQSLLYKKVET